MMLVLNRKEADVIVINGTIRVKVLKIKRNTICLGIDAPLDVSVLRSELTPFGNQSEALNADSNLRTTLPRGKVLVNLPR
ncbi:MAG: carbon storage regulator [Planctomycetota bacterium]|nr:carbon storage regulator [Planctomycetota bacterium]